MTDDNSSGKPEDEDERPPAAWIPDEVGSQGDDEPVERAHRQRPYCFVGPIIPPIRVPFLDGLFKQ